MRRLFSEFNPACKSQHGVLEPAPSWAYDLADSGLFPQDWLRMIWCAQRLVRFEQLIEVSENGCGGGCFRALCDCCPTHPFAQLRPPDLEHFALDFTCHELLYTPSNPAQPRGRLKAWWALCPSCGIVTYTSTHWTRHGVPQGARPVSSKAYC